MFINSRRVFVIGMFYYAVVYEACRATNILLITVATRVGAGTLHFFINTIRC